MRPGQQNKRGRGRGSSSGGSSNGGGGSNGGNNNFNRKGGNPLSRSYDSSGPDVKIRGTAQHIAEKYSTLARDAHSAGDRVMAENYLQHAEHYYRIIAAAQAQMQDRFQNQERGEYQDRDGNSIDQDDMDQGDGDDLGYAPQPMMDDQPRREHNSGQNSGQHSGQNSGQNAGQNAGQNSGQNQGNQSGQDQQPRENRRDRNERRERRPERPDRPERQDRAERAPDQASEHVVEQPAAPAIEQPVAPTRTRQRAPQVTEAPVAVAPVVDGSGPQPDIEGTPVEVSVEEESQTEATPRRRRTAANRPRRQTRKDADAADGGDAGDGDDKPALAEAGE